MKMVAVKGIYEGGNTVRIDGSELSISEPYEVVVSFLQPAKQSAEKQAEQSVSSIDSESVTFAQDFVNKHIAAFKALAK